MIPSTLNISFYDFLLVSSKDLIPMEIVSIAFMLRSAQQHILDVDEHKEHERENVRRNIGERFILMTSGNKDIFKTV